MSDRKRDSNQVLSPRKARLDKRRKDANQKENEIPYPRLKTKYVFAPANNLSCSTPLKQIRVDPNIPKNGSEPQVPKDPKEIVRNDNHSSDDHVFWAPTPKQNKQQDPSTSTKGNLPSSPLATEPLKLDPIGSVSNKYQAMMYDNFASQRSPTALKTTPVILKPKSESFPSGSVKTMTGQKSIFRGTRSLTNSPATPLQGMIKRKDISTLINAIESGFDTSVADIQDTPEPFPEKTKSENKQELKKVEVQTDIKELEPPADQKAAKKSNVSFDLSSDFFSDDFSDDFMSDLDRVLEKKPSTSQVKSDITNPKDLKNILKDVGQKDMNKLSEKLSQNELKDKSETDEFEDIDDDMDDDEFDQMIDKKLTQAPPQAAPRLTTQEERIQKIDFEGQKIFKQDIDNTDMKTESFKKVDENWAKAAFQRNGVKRLQVTQVLKSFFMQKNIKRDQKILTAIDADSVINRVVVREPWVRLDIEVGDVIHIVGKDHKIVDQESNNLLIWNPDLLLSATLIGDTVNCYRRSVLKTRIDFRGDYSVPLIVGEIVHALFQSVLRERNCQDEFLQGELEQELDSNLLTILVINESKDSIRAEVQNHIPYIKTWYKTYVSEKPQPNSKINVSGKREKSLFSASNILDIEENIWSPIYGLRGLIDVTIEANLQTPQIKGKFITPLEIKSGNRAQIAHGAQASLYALLLRDRYEMDVEFFMLVYTRLKETTKFEIDERRLKDLVMCRNLLSKYLKEGSRLLPDLKQSADCDNCYAIAECMTYNKLMEDGDAENSGLKDNVYDDLTLHLDNDMHKKFFNYWDDLITKEEGSINSLKKDLFLIDGPTREKTSGKCLSNLVIKTATDDEQEENKTYHYSFQRKNGTAPLNTSQVSKFDRIIVSDESGHFALCSGFVVGVRPEEIVISTTRRLKNNNIKLDDFNDINNQTYQTVLRPMGKNESLNKDVTYRIDKDEMFHGLKSARFNLLNLFLKDGDISRRQLIVEGKKPEFSEGPTPYLLEDKTNFNSDQIKAFNKVLSAKDYALLLGMPGTGKTTVIAQLIRLLVSQGKTILLTSYTHSAVDNILMKIKNDGIGIVRLGSASKIHPEIKEFSPYQKSIKTTAELNEAFLDPPVVATTCLGISDWVFNRRRFDYCIVDESSQVSMPVCLGPLAFCEKFVLVGDHYQLPPLIVNNEAKAGLSKSLFKTLSEEHPESVVDLTYQYRMCSDIMLLSNTIIYEGRLKCGSDAVANQSLKIPHLEKLNESCPPDLATNQRWIENILDENKKVLFLNHDTLGGCEETASKENIENAKEAELVYQIVEAMLLCGVQESSIGVMSFYRAQLRLFYRKFYAHKEIEMLTADQFQGRDKDCVIISLVRSNNRNDAGSLLKEWRRVNVAITRARSKLIIIGSKRTLQSLQTINAFMNILNSRGWFYDLPPQADTFYSFVAPPNLEELSSNNTRKPSQVKPISQSKALQNKSLTKDIATEMGL